MIGEIIGGYAIEKVLGEGGMGVVYLARHQMLERRAAVKLLLPEFSTKQDMVRRIFTEARVMAAIHHPGLVLVYDTGMHTNGSAYLIMEFLEGEPLSARLAREGPFAIDTLVPLAGQIADAIGAAHAKEIIHRDLKPDNVFLVPAPDVEGGFRAKLLDFGIAKLASAAPHAVVKTRTGSLIGTPAYMSPEQCRGAGSGQLDARSDIYSLGCVFFEMATGRRPFMYDNIGELIAAHLHETPPRSRSLVSSLPPKLDTLLAAMLSKDAKSRPSSMQSVLSSLESIPLKKASRPAPRQPSLPPTALTTLRQTPSTFSRLAGEVSTPPPARKWPLAAALVLAVAATGIIALATREDATPPAAAPVPVPAAAPAPVPVPAPAPAPPPVLEPTAILAIVAPDVPEPADEPPPSVAAPPPKPSRKPKPRPAPTSTPAAPIKDGSLDPYGQ